MITLHVADAPDILTQKANFEKHGSSVHFAIDSNATIFQLVDTANQAFSAGVSSFGSSSQDWRSINNINTRTLNSFSVSIVLLSPGYARGEKFEETAQPEDRNWYVPGHFGEAQMDQAANLILQLIDQFNINPKNVLGFGDVAHGANKTSPLPWDYLATRGIGMTLPPVDIEGEEMDTAAAQKTLYDIGYVRTPQTGELDEATVQVLLAFQQHFMASRFADPAYAQSCLANPESMLDSQTFGALKYVLNHK